ncbi:YdcH family protein [Helicobacter pylori]|uniref:YdcH family protein n=1 Tax=Helicobacter pylori TaxID=210 RepID=UPI0012B242F2|nr:YdcH family protein [Helicobacter pylori]WRD86352.1 YdcH family protein [Helicobacter pylori]
MFHEFRDEISVLKANNPHFDKIFEKHNQLDDDIKTAEQQSASDAEVSHMKKQKLKLKDEIHSMIIEYREKQKSERA